MPLGAKPGWDKLESRYCGVETEFEDDMPQLLSFNLSVGGFDFVLAPLMDPTYRPNLMEKDSRSSVLPFAGSDLILSPSQWSNHVVEPAMDNIKGWVTDDTTRSSGEGRNLKHEIWRHGRSDHEMLKSYATGLLALCLAGYALDVFCNIFWTKNFNFFANMSKRS